jgi:hypothetical protein
MAKCGLFYGEYPDSIEFIIFGMGGVVSQNAFLA